MSTKITVEYPSGVVYTATLSEAELEPYQPFRSWYSRKPAADGKFWRRIRLVGPRKLRLRGVISEDAWTDDRQRSKRDGLPQPTRPDPGRRIRFG